MAKTVPFKDFALLAQYYDDLMSGDCLYMDLAIKLLQKQGFYNENGEYIYGNEDEDG